MTNIRIDNDALERIMLKDSGVKIIVECNISEYKIKYLIKELEKLGVSKETLKTLGNSDKASKAVAEESKKQLQEIKNNYVTANEKLNNLSLSDIPISYFFIIVFILFIKQKIN